MYSGTFFILAIIADQFVVENLTPGNTYPNNWQFIIYYLILCKNKLPAVKNGQYSEICRDIGIWPNLI